MLRSLQANGGKVYKKAVFVEHTRAKIRSTAESTPSVVVTTPYIPVHNRSERTLFEVGLLLSCLERLEDGIRDLVGGHLAPEVGGDEALAENRVDGIVDLGRGLGEAHELEHERGGPDRGDRVRDGRHNVGDVGGRAVDGLTWRDKQV